MKSYRLIPVLVLLLHASLSACGEKSDNWCRDVDCQEPPASTCKDATTLLEYDPVGTCIPSTGSCSYASRETPCARLCSHGVCDPQPNDDFILEVRPGTTMCTLWNDPDVFAVYASKGILYFKEGRWRLPRDQERFEADLIEKLELSPHGEEARPTGAGVFTRTIHGTPNDGQYVYNYARGYELDDAPFQLELIATFRVEAGEAVEPVKLVDDGAILLQCTTSVRAEIRSATWTNAFITCQTDHPDLFTPTRVEVTVANGDAIHFHLRLSYPCCCLFPGDWAELVRTELTRGQQQRVVTGFFRQAFSARHHIFIQSLLAQLDTPVDDIHAVLLREADSDNPTLEYLDAQLNVIETPAISDVQIHPGVGPPVVPLGARK